MNFSERSSAVERRISNLLVEGSNPSVRANFSLSDLVCGGSGGSLPANIGDHSGNPISSEASIGRASCISSPLSCVVSQNSGVPGSESDRGTSCDEGVSEDSEFSGEPLSGGAARVNYWSQPRQGVPETRSPKWEQTRKSNELSANGSSPKRASNKGTAAIPARSACEDQGTRPRGEVYPTRGTQGKEESRDSGYSDVLETPIASNSTRPTVCEAGPTGLRLPTERPLRDRGEQRAPEAPSGTTGRAGAKAHSEEVRRSERRSLRRPSGRLVGTPRLRLL